ncbi:M61 family metallopeptidase [Stakelama sediminis]|uniref:Putative metalloprotease with PDZ domain n=1 Tax=Stakelama sediminis TaxID=463200 RepID=A0A840YZI9_9SPHN|nr:M61 family metallopeptidase [Stakelama sediminis]MBB5719118.1 putative metalloprotease with PDZ domain [Stakelama sediminis]
MIRSFAVATLLLASVSAHAQELSKPMATPVPHDVPVARDVAYPGGTIDLNVDATNVGQGIFQVKETIPVAASGPMTLLFPSWLPGNHSPRGAIEKLAGLKIMADGKEVPWKRDTVTVTAFHIDVPEGAKSITAEFQFLSATNPDQGRIVMEPNILNLQWNSVSLYPAGYYVRDIPIRATVKYPEGWTAVSGLPATKQGNHYVYNTTNYQVLVDSPVFAGRYYKQWALSPKVDLNVWADDPKELDATPAQIDAHKRLVQQAVKLFGAQHYDHYEFLLALSDKLGGIGLEHHRSSENNPGTGYFTKWDEGAGGRNLLPHEYTHSWNGKFRRPANLWTPDYATPMRDEGLWVYEGQTQFWGYVLGNRSGIYSKQQTLDAYARIAAYYANQPGRKWRSLIDTTNDPIIAHRKPIGWRNYQRSEDYYNNGLLMWMDVDSILRKQSGGTKSMDDFAKAFFGMRNGDWGELTFTRQDVIDTLNKIQPYDWGGFFHKWLDEVNDSDPAIGFENNGYKLVYNDTPSDLYKEREKKGGLDLTIGLGLAIAKDGNVEAVQWNSPAFQAGMDIADKIVAINGKDYDPKLMKQAVTDAKDSKDPIRLLLKKDDGYHEIAIDYHGGLRYPHLVKIGKGETGLDRLLAPQ